MSGLRTTNTDVLNVSNNIGLGTNFDTGTAGQVLASGGDNQPCSWVANSGGGGGAGAFLRASGTGITIVNATTGLSADYTGADNCLISATDDTNYTAGDGINGVALATNIIQVDTDNTTMNKLGSSPVANSLQVLKVPNALTFTQASGNIVFDGSSTQSIDLDAFVDTAGNGISITGTEISTDNDDTTIKHNTTSGKNEVIKVPNDLTIINGANTITYNGGSSQSISIPSGLSSIVGSGGIAISGGNIISVLTDSTSTGTLTTADSTLVPPNQLQVVKVPNALTIVADGVSVVFDGSSAKSLSIDTGLASVQAGLGISISGASSNIINAQIDNDTITYTSGTIPPNQLQVEKVPNALGITFDGTTTTYDGSSTKVITITPDDTNAGDGIAVSGAGTTASPRVIATSNDDITITHDATTKKNKVLQVPFDLVAGNNITMTGATTSGSYDGREQVIINSVKDGANQENSFYTRLFPNSLFQFPYTNPPASWFDGSYGFTAFHPNFYIDIPEAVAGLPAYANFKVVVSVYEEERIAGRRTAENDNRNGLIDFIDGAGARISPVYFFQSGGGLTTQSGSNPLATIITGGRGQIEFSCILSMPPSPRPTTTRIQPRFSNGGINSESSSHHLFQAGLNGTFEPTGVIHKKEWILETHPINPSNFRNLV